MTLMLPQAPSPTGLSGIFRRIQKFCPVALAPTAEFRDWRTTKATRSCKGPMTSGGLATPARVFRLSALNTQFYLPTGASRKDLESAIRGHVIASAVLMGRYAKTSSQ
jgi:hypothetical protein